MSKKSVTLLLGLLLSLLNCSTSSEDDAPTVITRTAVFRGKRMDVHPAQLPNLRASVVAYTRVPYAEPPVGELRYARPVPRVVRGEFVATGDSVACPQIFLPAWNLNITTSEDCLYLDVFVPEPRPTSAAVIVWFHGGGYHMGAGSIPRVLPTPLVALGGVIVVTCNFRLGPLAFLATGDDAIPANLGLLDQRLVLLWVQDNIAAFGGDPRQVSLCGMSSGAGSINLHLLSPMSAGLFSRVIMQSGSVGASWVHHESMQEAVQMTFDLGKAIGCDAITSGELVACLRQKRVDEILAPYSNRTTVVGDFFVRPVVDGQFLLDDPLKLASEGAFNKADVLVGCMKEEGILSIMLGLAHQQMGCHPPFLDQAAFLDLIAKYLDTHDPVAMETAAFVYSTEEQLSNPAAANYLFSAGKLVGNKMTLCPAFTTAQHLCRAGLSVYSYLMTHAPSHPIWGQEFGWMKAAHGEDVPYVFGSPLLLTPAEEYRVVGRFGNKEEVDMSVQVIKYWSNFAKTGNPNLCGPSDAEPVSAYPPWPRFTIKDPMYKELSIHFANRKGTPDSKQCHFLSKMLPQLIQHADEMTLVKNSLQDSGLPTPDQICDD